MIHPLYRDKTPPCPLENTGYEEHCLLQYEIVLDDSCPCPYTDLCKDFMCVMNYHDGRCGGSKPTP